MLCCEGGGEAGLNGGGLFPYVLVSMLLSAHVEKFSVSRTQDFTGGSFSAETLF